MNITEKEKRLIKWSLYTAYSHCVTGNEDGFYDKEIKDLTKLYYDKFDGKDIDFGE